MSKLQVLQTIIRDTLTDNQIRTWITDQDTRAQKVSLYRDYVEGDHDIYLTERMKKQLNLMDGARTVHNTLNDNYMDVVVQTMVDRLEVTGLDAITDSANSGAGGTDITPAQEGATQPETAPKSTPIEDWLEQIMQYNRFDGLQIGVHEAAIRDGDTFLMVYWDNDAKAVRFSHEPAFDGNEGMLAIYKTASAQLPEACVKIWSEGDDTRLNIYYADRVEKYIVKGTTDKVAGTPTPFDGDGDEDGVARWTNASGEGIGLPVIHFRNRGKGYKQGGESEIANAIPLQDALNRLMYSTIMAAELTAFQLRYAIGFDPPPNVAPGDWVTIKDPPAKDDRVETGTYEQGELVPYLDTMRHLALEIGKITRTPAPEFMGADSSSGEALKQREIGLLGKVRRFQVTIGNAWEDVFEIAHHIQTAFGQEKPPDYSRLNTQWRDAEIRNDETTIKNIMLVADKIGEKETLRQIGQVFGWDEAKIDELISEKKQDRTDNIAQLTNELTPNFAQFNTADFEPQDTPPRQNGRQPIESIGA